ncbi:phosphatidylserine synthase [[Haemophilus] ducreyi]|uniref:CDP-diacylglycerol--serine O-phosphatidyltransferase n=2 Tax=Haemophilus ducreyi TaxID=730 RepID=Q7VP35_HAEDU|nr:CDP-diacylglycerol--serine O-phosphatidyltransferase [[Haemophilus] ducreyi]AAP95252.1 CDP-diacylglycerol--serine O-phosphatidyltransferase [[Haemophilus] ducreyi 35000HP]AKO30397.1 phosphatidylserine synthase [[Haemophilus] ducreyi]AKO31831.1 phosphatidylserine synthase [[Haemophilus] ducreyi]AKO33283.1 phosphatidylserine synthase [[Haemophilus] ducreyi]AKO34733.1 phosphatidylserine synthase [[Haemophilus] ducreyi]
MLIINKLNHAQKQLEKLNFIPQQADKVDFLASSSEFKARILQLINTAKSRIYLTALYFEQDEAGQQILAALYQAKLANPALDIQILVDWHRAQRGRIGEKTTSSNADWYANMKQQYNLPPEQEIAVWGVPINGREIFGVLHLKGFIFDDTILYSGASINNVYLQQFDRYRYDRYHTLENKVLADSLVTFLQQHILTDHAVNRLDNMQRPVTANIRPAIKAFRKQLTKQQYQFAEQPESNGLMLSPIAGLGRKNQLNKTIEALFYKTQNKLTICTPYFNFPRSLITRIKWLLENGKQVEIIAGDKKANDFYTPPDKKFTMAAALPYLYEKNLRAFAKRFDSYIQNKLLTIRLWKDGENTYHLKGLWVDNRYILLTGNNLNPRAWGLDAENGILLDDPKAELAEKAALELTQIRTFTQELSHYSDLETIKDYPLEVQKLLKKFGRVKLDKIIKMLL